MMCTTTPPVALLRMVSHCHTQPSSTTSAASSSVAQSLVPYPQYNYIFNNFEGFGTTYYQSAQINLEKRFSSGLSFLAGYTLSRLMDNTNSGFSSFTSGGINKYNQKPEYTISNSDEPQTLKVSGTYELPIGPGKRFVNNHKLGNIAGGWQIGWILDYEAGTPMSGCDSSSVCESGSPFPNGFNRPDRNPSVSLSTASYSRVRDYFLTAARETARQCSIRQASPQPRRSMSSATRKESTVDSEIRHS